MAKEIYEIETVKFYSIQRDDELTVRIGRMFTRSGTSKLFRVMSAECGDSSVRVKNGVAACQSEHCDEFPVNQWTCDHVRAVNALIN